MEERAHAWYREQLPTIATSRDHTDADGAPDKGHRSRSE